MFEFEYNEAVIIQQQKALEAALSTDPKAEKVLRKIIRKYILEARKEVVDNIHFKGGDPRHTANAVRTSVYKRVFGANLNIMDSRRSHGSNNYEPRRTLRPGQVGGNRVPRSARTDAVMHYAPLDRGFILRFQNSGTGPRMAGTRNGRLSGNRGSIAARNFFRPLGDRALGMIYDNLTTAIETEMAALMNNNK